MGDIVSIRSGGGGVKLFAVISVTYPEGSVCTCTKGTKSYKAKNTSGLALFAVPEVGDWTVSCTDGTDTASKTVTISTEGQSVNVVLTYQLYLYNSGDECTAVTGGWKVEANISESSAKESNRIWTGNLKSAGNQSLIYMKNPSSLIKGYETLKIQIARDKIVDKPSFGILLGTTSLNNLDNNTKDDLYIAYKDIGKSTGEIALDISNATAQSMRVAILSLYSSYIYKIWLE